jgi:hypothetical protein
MRLAKTECGKEALEKRDHCLKPRMLQVLILANGTHSRESIQDLLEHDIGAELHWLLQSGYIEEVDIRYRVARSSNGSPFWSLSQEVS